LELDVIFAPKAKVKTFELFNPSLYVDKPSIKAKENKKMFDY
jgi:hypothetical protein